VRPTVAQPSAACGVPMAHPTVADRPEPPKRITMWNKRENRKISGNAAPMEKNMSEYLRKHPECEIYNGQRSQLDPAIRAAQLAAEPRITIWNKSERRKVSGNAAPLEKNITEYLRKHPDCEVYNGQDKRPPPYPMPQARYPPMMPRAPVAAAPPGAIPQPKNTAKIVYGSPVCTLDFLCMVACQENLDLLHAEDYETDADEPEEVAVQPKAAMKSEAAMIPIGKRSLECTAIDLLVKRVKAA